MKTPVFICQKPEHKMFGKVKVAVLVLPTQILDPEEMPGMIMF